ncbi:hypothetical protein [Nocardia miyunensis]|nr:hypothetical protein [Nocardia miyunensis]
MDAQSLAELGQRTVSDHDAVPADTEPQPGPWLGVIGAVEPGSPFVDGGE